MNDDLCPECGKPISLNTCLNIIGIPCGVIIEIEIPEEALEEMRKSEEELDKIMEEAIQREKEAWKYIRDDE